MVKSYTIKPFKNAHTANMREKLKLMKTVYRPMLYQGLKGWHLSWRKRDEGVGLWPYLKDSLQQRQTTGQMVKPLWLEPGEGDVDERSNISACRYKLQRLAFPSRKGREPGAEPLPRQQRTRNTTNLKWKQPNRGKTQDPPPWCGLYNYNMLKCHRSICHKALSLQNYTTEQ